MLYVVLFRDNADRAEARQRLMPAPLAFLEEHRHQIRAAGALREVADGAGAGGLWLVEAESHGAVDDLVHRARSGEPAYARMSASSMAAVFSGGRRRI